VCEPCVYVYIMHRWHAEAFSAKTFFGWRGGIGGLEEERQVIIPGGLRHSRSGGRNAWSLEDKIKQIHFHQKHKICSKTFNCGTSHSTARDS
jgi:hypothetical protein